MAKRLRNTARIQYECEGNCDGNMMGPYPCVVCTKYVDGKPVGMTVLGEDIAVWRGSDGRPVARHTHGRPQPQPADPLKQYENELEAT